MQQSIFNAKYFAPRMFGKASPKREVSPEKELTEIKKFKTEEITTEIGKFRLLIETLLIKVEKEQEQNSDLDSTNGFVDGKARLEKRLLNFFREKSKNLIFPRVSRLH